MHTIVWTLLMLLSLVPCTFAQDTSRPFFGLLHSHTSFSDGSGTPADAYQSAKAAGLHSGMWPTPLSYRHVEELMEERGVSVDHATVQRWVVKYSPLLEEAFQRRKRSVWVSWLMDETYIKVKGERCYLYRAVDKQGQTIDFLLTEHRDKEAACAF